MNKKNQTQKVQVLAQTPQLISLFTKIRDKNTKREEFIFYSDLIMRMLIEEGLNFLSTKEKKIKTPINITYQGREFVGKICAVSIIRAGEAMEKGVREICRKIRIGKILIQRDEKTAEPILYYSKLPKSISKRTVLLLDPMLATGGSVCKAIEVIKQNNVKEDKIIFINLISCPEGIKRVQKTYPKVRIITGVIDKALNSKKYIIPGLGDFGDRYFGSE